MPINTLIVLNCSTIKVFFFFLSFVVLSISYYHIPKEVVAIGNRANKDEVVRGIEVWFTGHCSSKSPNVTH